MRGSPKYRRCRESRGIEGIVIAEASLDDGDSDVADDTSNRTDEKGRKRSDEAAAGVMATKPAIQPEAAPRMVGFPWTRHSTTTQATVAAAAAA